MESTLKTNEVNMDYKKIKSILKWILVLNLFVAFLKMSTGLLTGTVSILSDGLHSLFDGLTNIVGLLGIRLAERPADEDHPYGHQKIEAVASQVIVLFLALTAFEIGEKIIDKLLNPPEAIYVDWLVFAILAACIVIDGFVARYEYKKGVELKSIILRADSAHTRSHYITTGAVILGMLLIKFGFPWFVFVILMACIIIDFFVARYKRRKGQAWKSFILGVDAHNTKSHYIATAAAISGIILMKLLPSVFTDPIIAFFVVGFIIKLGYSIFQETTGILSDKALVKEEMIKQIAEALNEVKSCHSIRTRGDEAHIFLDFHLTFSGDITLESAHKICDELEEKIKSAIPEVKDITIHIEPH